MFLDNDIQNLHPTDIVIVDLIPVHSQNDDQYNTIHISLDDRYDNPLHIPLDDQNHDRVHDTFNDRNDNQNNDPPRSNDTARIRP
jgi:heat shock protein HspQ